MKRLTDWHLKHWKEDPKRKPLVLRGARQVGKTHAVRTLGKSFDSVVEINFELTPEARTIFQKDLKPERILWELNLLTNTKIIPGETLLFLDEVQVAPQVITALRYFYEEFPNLHLIAAGSLLDFAIEQVGMPVGRINTLYLYPLSFLEFLAATNNSRFIPAIMSGEILSEILHEELLSLLSHYLAIGGMPEVVSEWAETKDPQRCFEVQKQLIETYQQDFPKYARLHQIKYVDILFNQIPHFIGQQFKYSSIHGEYKKRELSPCLSLLKHANVVHQITHTAGNGLPLGAEVNLEKFKLILIDVGISQAILGLNIPEWFLSSNKDLINRGTIVEAFVGQELNCYAAPKWKNSLYFWKRETKGSLAEVDFLCEFKGEIIPIEVKSGHGTTLRSMHQFLLEHPKSQSGIRFWSKNYSSMDSIHSRPLYAVASLAHEEQRKAIQSLI